MRISDLAKKANCTVETVRYYEREGLLPSPSRSAGNYRNYSAVHVERLQFIRNCRGLDMALDEVRALLDATDRPESNCATINELIESHIEHVDTRIKELRALRKELATLRNRCLTTDAVQACGIVKGLAKLSIDAKSGRATHL